MGGGRQERKAEKRRQAKVRCVCVLGGEVGGRKEEAGTGAFMCVCMCVCVCVSMCMLGGG